MNKTSSNIKFAILATDVVIFTVDGKSIKVLLTDAKSAPFKGMLTLPGGLIRPSEEIEAAVKRFIAQGLSVSGNYNEQLFTFGDPNRDPGGRVVSVTYLALVPWKKAKSALKSGYYWKAVNGLPELAYDHTEVLGLALERLIGKLSYTNIVYGLMPEEFTLTELQNVYETILKKKLDKRNFRKKIHSLKILKKLSKMRKNDATRPAQLYELKGKKLEMIDVL